MEANNVPLVLIVDDYAEGREVCAQYLAFRGYRVATAEDGLDALDKTHALHPDVILMDLSLPRLDGWEASRRLKADERTRHIPIIALTAHALSSARDRAMAAGCSSVVTKPCPPRDLEAEVRRQLGMETESPAAP
jgi:two-component system, cell cycle response regulator DivK